MLCVFDSMLCVDYILQYGWACFHFERHHHYHKTQSTSSLSLCFLLLFFIASRCKRSKKNACFSSSFFFYFCVSSLAVLLALAAQFALFILCSIRISSIFREFFYVLPLNGCFDAGSMHK